MQNTVFVMPKFNETTKIINIFLKLNENIVTLSGQVKNYLERFQVIELLKIDYIPKDLCFSQ
jgi:hypothetical protein